MADLLTHPLMLRGLYVLAMAGAFLRYRNPRRREVGRHQTAFYEQMWREAAEEFGGSWTQLASGLGEIEINGSRSRVVDNVSEIDDPVTLAVLHDKMLTHRLLQEEGLPVPRHAAFSLREMMVATRFLEASDCDCVIKPASGTGGGRGVSTGIRSRWHLTRAAALAAVYSDELAIEEQIEGENYRLLYLDGQLIDAFMRRMPTVVGDGRSTIARLVAHANDERRRRGVGLSQVLLTVDLDMRRTLAKQGLSLRSVPARGRSIRLKTVVNENSGADNTTATHLLCKSIVEDGARAVRALRVRFAGIDIITRDPRLPLAEGGGAIIEVNGTPNLYYHYHKLGGSFPVATHLLSRLMSAAARPAAAQPETMIAEAAAGRTP